MTKTAFKVRLSIIYLQKNNVRRWCLLVLKLVKSLTFLYKTADLSVIANISVKTLWRWCYSCYFCISSVLNFFQIIIVSLFFARHDHYFTMLKDLSVFKFTNFLFKAKYNNTVIYSVNSNYSHSRKKQERKIVETILWLNVLCIYCYSSKTQWFLEGIRINWQSLISPEN